VNAHFDLTHIARTAEELDKLLGGDDERLFHDMLIGESDIDHVVTRIHEQAARDEEMLLGITERQGAIAARKQRIESRIAAAKMLIGKVLRAGRLTKLELPEVTYSIRLGKPGLKVVDPEAVPEEYQRIKREPDKPKINETFAQSDALPNWVVRTPATDVVTARTR
jgi:hypothetical protein